MISNTQFLFVCFVFGFYGCTPTVKSTITEFKPVEKATTGDKFLVPFFQIEGNPDITASQDFANLFITQLVQNGVSVVEGQQEFESFYKEHGIPKGLSLTLSQLKELNQKIGFRYVVYGNVRYAQAPGKAKGNINAYGGTYKSSGGFYSSKSITVKIIDASDGQVVIMGNRERDKYSSLEANIKEIASAISQKFRNPAAQKTD